MRRLTVRLVAVVTFPTSLAMQITRPWTTKHWCESVIRPEWPFAYSKYRGQIEETKGRVSTNMQDVRHECDARGVQSKCHICEDIACGPDENNLTCHFQLQGVSTNDMSANIPTVSDVPWAVNGSHRYDFGGASTTHVCMYLSGTPPCQSNFGQDYSKCELRCWGHGDSLSGENSTAAYVTKMLLLFYPFRENHDFPLFEDRWKFFCEAHERGSLYWDSSRIMQNIQNVQNSKKIVSKQESVATTIKT